MKRNSYLLLSLLLVGCNKNVEDIQIISPTGAPSIAFYEQAGNKNFQTNGTPSNIVSMMTSSSDKDIVVIDTVSGIKAINAGANFKIAATITFGNFFCVVVNIYFFYYFHISLLFVFYYTNIYLFDICFSI